MEKFKDITDSLSKGLIPDIGNDLSIIDLAHLFLKVAKLSSEAENLLLLGIENHFIGKPIPKEVLGLNNFFRLASTFERDKNGVNRFFDALLGLRSLGNLAKFDQITEEKLSPDKSSPMRIRGSFEYSHTQSHYSILFDLFNYLNPSPGELVVDLGSGFGRLGSFISMCFPEVSYLGLELIEKRVECSKKIALKNNFENIKYQVQDILDQSFVMPNADCYFFYDPLEQEDLINFTKKMELAQKINARNFKILAVEGYDDFIIKHFSSLDWLRLEKSFADKQLKQSYCIFSSVTT